MSQILVYPVFKVPYYTFYLQGLFEIYGRRQIRYTTGGFPKTHHHCLMFVVPGDPPTRIYLSAGDGPGINDVGLEWCDIYGKINIDPNYEGASSKKVVPIGPSFGIRLWSMLGSGLHAARAAVLTRMQRAELRGHLILYYAQYRKRVSFAHYNTAEKVRTNYVFFASSLWSSSEKTNETRAAFIRVCRQTAGIDFEGGFAPRKQNDIPGYSDLTFSQRYSMKAYLEKTKQSMFVFNTPAVQNCHSWHLAEYLALGKAIISTPLTRLMPEPVVHGKHMHFVDGSPESIAQAVERLKDDHDYRQQLEQGASQYYRSNLEPAVVIRRLLQRVADERKVTPS